MIPLQQLQGIFMDALFKAPNNPATAQLSQLLGDNEQLTAEEQIAIYRNSVLGCMVNALRQTYPVCNKLVGDTFFDAMAAQFIYNHPSLSPDLGNYGESFANFIATFKPAAQLVYLPDVARLEWAWECAFSAADRPGLDIQSLSQLNEQQQSSLHFHLPPGSHLMTSKYPIAKIWQVNQDEYRGDDTVNLNEGGNNLLVWRQDLNMRIDTLNCAQWQFLNAIQQDRAFIDICNAFVNDNSVPIETLMPECVEQGWIASFSSPA